MKPIEIKNKMDNKIINDLCSAMDLVEEFYYTMPKVTLKEDILIIDEDESEEKKYERRYVSQLKEKYGNIIAASDGKDYLDTNRDLEVIKPYIWGPDKIDSVIKSSYLKLYDKGIGDSITYLTTIPDFFIHKSQENREYEFQKLAVEAKTTTDLTSIEFFKDLFKLNVYVDKFNFQNATFVILHNNYDSIISKIEEYLSEQYFLARKNRDGIYFIVRENFKSENRIIKLTDKI